MKETKKINYIIDFGRSEEYIGFNMMWFFFMIVYMFCSEGFNQELWSKNIFDIELIQVN